jgi:UDP-glucuronate 4-epimerase
MKILVTGAAGFIGSALAKKLIISGHRVTAIDNFSDYYDVNLKKSRVKTLLEPVGLQVTDLDISKQHEVATLIASIKPDVVINLAAQAGVRLGVSETYKYVESNLIGFSNVLIATVENKTPFFLYASSSSVYGDKASIPYKESEKNLHPNSFYGVTKLANELLTPTLVRNSSTTARGLRFFTVYGPWGRPDMAYFRMISNVVSESEFNFFGDGTIERDFTYIQDSVDSTIALMNELKSRKPGYSDLVNVGGGRPLSMNYLMETVSSLANKQVSFKRVDGNSNDAVKTMSDSTYIQTLIGIRPNTKLEDGLVKTFEWATQSEISVNLDNWVNSVK